MHLKSELHHHTKNWNVQSASLLLLLLLSTDVAFTVLHILKHTAFASSAAADARINATLEIYHLAKQFLIIALFIHLRKTTKCAGFVSWILIFSFMLIDDAFLLHQNIGHLLENSAGILLSRLDVPSRVYELAVLGLAGIPLGGILALAYLRSSDLFREISKALFLFITGLVFFGLIVDAASVFNPGPLINRSLDIIEDSGEMVVYSLIIWYLFSRAISSGAPDPG